MKSIGINNFNPQKQFITPTTIKINLKLNIKFINTANNVL